MTQGVAAICFIVDGDRILLMQAPWAEHRWSVIGGRLEPGETPDEAVRREVFEETGLTLADCRSAGQLLRDEGNGHSTLIHLFVSTRQTGDLRGSIEGEPVWWPLSAIDDLPMIDYIREMLPQVLGR